MKVEEAIEKSAQWKLSSAKMGANSKFPHPVWNSSEKLWNGWNRCEKAGHGLEMGVFGPSWKTHENIP
jgi:hypothetical protein